jgi:hypothetical protein
MPWCIVRVQNAKAWLEHCRQSFTILTSWCSSVGAQVNPAKAKVTWFSLNNYIVNTLTPTLNFCMMVVERTPTMRYLGVQCDEVLPSLCT